MLLRAAFVAAVMLHTIGAEAEPDPESDSTVGAGPLAALGSYERNAVKWALSSRKLEIEASPEGKIVGRIHVVNLDVFGKSDGFLRFVNFLHVTTREKVIRREVILRPGQQWDGVLVEETQRTLKDPLFTSLVVLVPVRSKLSGQVDLLVVTRDIWSLRMNSSFEVLEGLLTNLQLSIAENNIFGLRKHGALVFELNQGNYTLGPQYIDKAVGGTHWRLTTRANAIFSRETNKFEGTQSSTFLNYPLWALSQKWGGTVAAGHSDSTIRLFRGIGLRTYDNPDTDEIEELPWNYRHRTLVVDSSVVRSFGESVKQRVTLGHRFSVARPEFLDDFSADDVARDAFARDVFPRSERVSAVFARYRVFTPSFVVYRNLNSYDLAEDVRLGPDLTAGLSFALKPIGSQNNFILGNISAAWVFDIAGDGFYRIAGGAATRLQAGEWIDNVFTGSVGAGSPMIAKTLRVVGKASMALRLHESGNRFYTLGGNNGLRGYVISEFAGQKRVLTNLELRSVPLRIWFARVGGVAFWDMGHVADRLGDLRMKHGVGIGLRYLIPQLQPLVFRFDWALPLSDPQSRFPGRFSAGVAQNF